MVAGTGCPDRPPSPTLSYATAQGRTLEEMRAAVTASPLYAKGDAKLVWINEGDFWALMMRGIRLVDDTVRSTTPAEDRDWVSIHVPGTLNAMGTHPVISSEGYPIEEGPDGKIRRVPPTPDLSGLKAALEGLREVWRAVWNKRHTKTFASSPELVAITRVFLAAERAGLLTDERPADPVEVAIAALEDIRKTAHGARVDGFPISARWVEYSADIALAALRQGRKG